MSEKILGWHFVNESKTLRDSSDMTVAPGYVYTFDSPDKPALCIRGLHASRKAIDALRYAPSPIICRVALYGDVIEGDDKLVARHREVLWIADASCELRLWACWCVRQVWHLLKDERSRNAVEVAERYAMGHATKQDLDAAWRAAREAANTTARYAAWRAALAAAMATASDAVRGAVLGAAKGAAMDAMLAAAWDAASGAVMDAQGKEFERRMLALEGKR